MSEETNSQASSPVSANYDRLASPQEVKFSFREVTEKDTGVKTKRPTIETTIAYPSVDGVVEIFNAGGKGLELLMQAVKDTIDSYARTLIADDETITSESFPHDKISWEAIANQPASERKGRGIAKEIWDEFYLDYAANMVALTGKPKEVIEKQLKIIATKFNVLKTHEDKIKILNGFKNQLGIYLNGSPNAEQYAACVEFLLGKADTLLTADSDANLADALGM